MKTKHLLLTTLLFLQSICAFCQEPPTEFFNGLDLYKTDLHSAKLDFLEAVEKAPYFHGSYHFLGAIYLTENRPDSAIWYFKKSISLNTGNVNHTREMSYVRLIDTYTFQSEFQNAFDAGWEALKQYPDNKSVKAELRDLCLWAFYIKDDHLDPSYLSHDIKDKYIVNSISEEYLILRNLNANGEYLQMTSQALAQKADGPYDVFKCTLSQSKKEVEVDFKINWDMNKDFGGKTTPQQPIIDDTTKPIYERIGAMLVADNKTDITAAIQKLKQ
jgi:hypothetical protein